MGLPTAGRRAEALNTDGARYGGSNHGNLGGVTAKAEPLHGLPASAGLVPPALAAVFFRFEGDGAR